MNEDNNIDETDEQELIAQRKYEQEEKFEELYEKYDDYVMYFCPKCNSPVYAFNVIDSCPYCRTPKIDLELIDSHEEYLENIKNDEGNLVTYVYVCQDCDKYFNFLELITNDYKCPNCGKKHIKRYNNEIEIEDEKHMEHEYCCESCYEVFTIFGNADKDIKCPNCGYVQEDVLQLEPDDFEPDYEPTEEEWEDIFD